MTTTATPTTAAAAAISSVVTDGSDIVALGSFNKSNFNIDALVIRLDHTGATVPGFGTNGVVTNDLATADYMTDVAVDTSGRVVVTGQAVGIFSGVSDISAFRLLSNGTLDPSFGRSA